ncbi:MAG: nucleotidyltransferase domain-containing protein [Nanoarchaeota archaeon]|nr:nucleotidyltransferase domain-containing protein [Nanoarchaeota archaeon]
MVKKHNTQQEILKFLLSHKKTEFTIRNISQKIGVDYKTVHGVIQELIKDNLIRAKKIGQTVLCSINPAEFNADIFSTELSRREELLKNKDLSSMYSYFKDIQEPFFILLLFGSYASGKNRKGSDIDLMLIADSEDIKKKIKSKIALIPLEIHLTEFNPREFISMLKTTEFNVGKEAFYNNIILYGIEDYYRLIQHA